MESSSDILKDPYQSREDPVSKCFTVAKDAGYKMFGLQHGGGCWAVTGDKVNVYRHGKSLACEEGKGGEWAINVYEINAACKE